MSNFRSVQGVNEEGLKEYIRQYEDICGKELYIFRRGNQINALNEEVTRSWSERGAYDDMSVEVEVAHGTLSGHPEFIRLDEKHLEIAEHCGECNSVVDEGKCDC